MKYYVYNYLPALKTDDASFKLLWVNLHCSFAQYYSKNSWRSRENRTIAIHNTYVVYEFIFVKNEELSSIHTYVNSEISTVPYLEDAFD